MNFLIKLFGGYTKDEVEKLFEELKKARRNDTPKDPKTGRFVKKK